ncbi:MAG: hypothetical protein U0446_10145 [Dehalococcoidia bacterium]
MQLSSSEQQHWIGDRLLLYGVLAFWCVVLGAFSLHRIVVSNDSLSNYAHVWYIADRLQTGNGIPYHFPGLAHGEALTFPYAAVPWLTAALLRPLLGDWVVTAWLLLGFLGLLAAVWAAFPELRRPLPAAVFLVNPFLIEAVLLFQLPFVWATAFLFAAVAAWRRQRVFLATLLAALCQSTHPAVAAPLLGCLVLVALPFEPRRVRLLAAYAAATALSLPAAWMTLSSPTFSDAGLGATLVNFVATVGLRSAVVVAGPLLAWVSPRLSPAVLRGVFVASCALSVVLVPLQPTDYAWGALRRQPDHDLAPYLASAAFTPGAVYRVLRAHDGKVTMYQVLQSGGVLDSEFFPESFARRSWGSIEDYRAFLDERQVDVVLLFPSYTDRFRTNEADLLAALTAEGCATRLADEDAYAAISVTRCRQHPNAP